MCEVELVNDWACNGVELVCGRVELVCGRVELVCGGVELVCGGVELVCGVERVFGGIELGLGEVNLVCGGVELMSDKAEQRVMDKKSLKIQCYTQRFNASIIAYVLYTYVPWGYV